MPNGHIRKNVGKKRTTYSVVVQLDEYDPESGRRLEQQETFQTRKAAKERLEEWLTELRGGTSLDASRVLFAEVLRGHLAAIKPPATRPTTYATYEFLAEKHIIPALGGVLIRNLRAQRIEDFYREKRASGRLDGKGGLAPKTIRELHNLVHAALDRAMKLRLVPRNESDLADVPEVERTQQKSWGIEESRAFLRVAVNDHYHPLWLLMLTTGMRRGEALGLRWRDIDRDAAIAHIAQQVIEIRGKKSIEPWTKTGAGTRNVTLSPVCMAALEEHKLRQNERRLAFGDAWKDLDLVFTTGTGDAIQPSNIDRAYRKLVKEANVPSIRPHDLRRTHSTLLRRQGVDPKVVSERLGHTSVEFTMDVYTNVLPEMAAAAAAAIDAALFPDPEERAIPRNRKMRKTG